MHYAATTRWVGGTWFAAALCLVHTDDCKKRAKIISLYFTFILFQRVQTSETNATRSIYFTLNLFHAKCAGSLNKTTISHSHVTLTFFDGEFLGEVEDVSSFLFGDWNTRNMPRSQSTRVSLYLLTSIYTCLHGYLSGARCRHAYGAADATATHCLLLQ